MPPSPKKEKPTLVQVHHPANLSKIPTIGSKCPGVNPHWWTPFFIFLVTFYSSPSPTVPPKSVLLRYSKWTEIDWDKPFCWSIWRMSSFFFLLLLLTLVEFQRLRVNWSSCSQERKSVRSELPQRLWKWKMISPSRLETLEIERLVTKPATCVLFFIPGFMVCFKMSFREGYQFYFEGR